MESGDSLVSAHERCPCVERSIRRSARQVQRSEQVGSGGVVWIRRERRLQHGFRAGPTREDECRRHPRSRRKILRGLVSSRLATVAAVIGDEVDSPTLVESLVPRRPRGHSVTVSTAVPTASSKNPNAISSLATSNNRSGSAAKWIQSARSGVPSRTASTRNAELVGSIHARRSDVDAPLPAGPGGEALPPARLPREPHRALRARARRVWLLPSRGYRPVHRGGRARGAPESGTPTGAARVRIQPRARSSSWLSTYASPR